MSCPIIPQSLPDCATVPFIQGECYPGNPTSLYYYNDPIVYNQSDLVYLDGPIPPKT